MFASTTIESVRRLPSRPDNLEWWEARYRLVHATRGVVTTIVRVATAETNVWLVSAEGHEPPMATHAAVIDRWLDGVVFGPDGFAISLGRDLGLPPRS